MLITLDRDSADTLQEQIYIRIRDQIVAGVAGFGICLMLWVLEWASSFESSVGGRIAGYVSVLSHFDTFSRGVLDSKDIPTSIVDPASTGSTAL